MSYLAGTPHVTCQSQLYSAVLSCEAMAPKVQSPGRTLSAAAIQMHQVYPPAQRTYYRVRCVPNTFQPSKDPSTGWCRPRRYIGTISQY